MDSAARFAIHSSISGQMHMMPAVADGSSPVATRGCLSRKQWADVRAAARTARDYGVQLIVHGITVTAASNFSQRCPPVDAIASVQRQPAEPAARRPTNEPTDQPSRPSKRQRRSSQRLAEFQAKKRASLLSASSRVRTFCRQFRWNRMQQVWIGWKQQQWAQEREQRRAQQQQQQQHAHIADALRAIPMAAAKMCHRTRFRASLRTVPFVAAAVRIRTAWSRDDRAAHVELTHRMLRQDLPRVRWRGLPLALWAERRSLSVFADWRG